MAYSIREFPPQGVKLPRNVVLTYAPITCDVLHAGDSKLWRRAQYMEMLRQYREQTPHVVVRDYAPGFLTGLFVPERDMANTAINVPLYRDMGLKGMVREGRKAFMQNWIGYYLTAKLLWDADANVEAIKHEFYETFFGPAAGPHVQAWWDACEAVLANSTTQAHEDFLVNHLYTGAFVSSIQTHVDAALAAEATAAQRERIAAFALIAENLEQYAAMHEAEQRLDYGAAADAASRMVAIKAELNAIYPFFISPDKRVRPQFAEGRAAALRELAGKTDGTAGDLVSALPRDMRVGRDPFNAGVIERWYLPQYSDAEWPMRDSYFLLEQQEPPLNERGYHDSGYVWYRTTIEIPPAFAGRDMKLFLGGIVNEGWVWVNGEFAGHREQVLWWTSKRHPFEISIGHLLRPGEPNALAIRVLNLPDEMGGLYRRGFVYAPKLP